MKAILQSLVLSATILAFPAAKDAQANNNGLSTSGSAGSAERLYTNLHNLSDFQLLFGHQNSTVQGIDPSFTDLNATTSYSDVFSSTGDYPAIMGFDFSDVNFPGISFNQFHPHVVDAYNAGSIVSFSFHAKNPETGGRYDDTQGSPVSDILNNGPSWIVYRSWLDDIASFFNSLSVNGQDIPVIFRPLHEGNGHWFWWGSSNSTSFQYRQLWVKTVNHLRSQGVDNVIYAYSPSGGVASSRYPGDSYVDIIAPSLYGTYDFGNQVASVAAQTVQFAASRNKVAALGEIGPVDGFGYPTADSDFYDDVLLNSIKLDYWANKISFALVWRNANPSHYWVPVSGDPALSSFLDFYSDKVAMFQSNLPPMYDPASTAINGFAYCSSPDADGAGFGWGFEFGRSCVVENDAQDPSVGNASNGYPYCKYGASDHDGDGWGFQSGTSCVVPGSPADPDD